MESRTTRSPIIEKNLTGEEVRAINAFGECWLRNYDYTKRQHFKKALLLWSWERPVIFSDAAQGKRKNEDEMNEMINPSRCAWCKHWDKRFPDNKELGVCLRMGVSKWPGRMHVSVTTDLGFHPSDTGDQRGTTRSNFGCVLHSDYVFTQMEGTV